MELVTTGFQIYNDRDLFIFQKLCNIRLLTFANYYFDIIIGIDKIFVFL